VGKRIRRNAEESRERILDCAIPILARHGIDDTSFRRISAAAGVSQPGILYHFKNKESLIEAAIRRVMLHNQSIVTNALEPHSDVRQRLRSHFRSNLTWAMKYRDEAQLSLLVYYMASVHQPLSKLYRELVEHARSHIRSLLVVGIQENQLDPDIDVEAATQLLHDALLGGIINELTLRGGLRRIRYVYLKWEELLACVLKGRNPSAPKPH
jgi:TetR/AcrR family acrAB operon transcriptional repressor